VFLDGLRGNLNEGIAEKDAVEMLAQHLITRPVFNALFEGDEFLDNNPVAQTMERMLAALDQHDLEAENEALHKFYDSVRRKVADVKDREGRQELVRRLYDAFFSTAFKKTSDKLGIVYTPVEIVDFILRSAEEVLQREFGQSLTEEGVHILDAFTGTGTFMVRLLELGLIQPHDLARKYAEELHANEILLLAYYIAAVNIETTYLGVCREDKRDVEYEPFPGLILTDTFQSWEDEDRPDLKVFPENNERLGRLKTLPITVILGNPPYSSGQESANDNNANERYPALDESIRRAYSSERGRGGNNSLYNSYIRAIRWATLRIGDSGVIAFVTSNGYVGGNAADQLRRSLATDFSSIYIVNLKGNMRDQDWRREGGQVFGAGSQAGVAITFLVKAGSSGPARIRYADIGDFLSREEKLARLQTSSSVVNLDGLEDLEPNAHGDWINPRDERYGTFIPLGQKHGEDPGATTVFSLYGRGLESGRDVWVFNSSERGLRSNVQQTISAYDDQVKQFASHCAAHPTVRPKDLVRDFIDLDPTRISWTLSLKNRLASGRSIAFDQEAIVQASYRPFCAQWCYFDRALIHIQGQSPRFFPRRSAHRIGWPTYITWIRGSSFPATDMRKPEATEKGHSRSMSILRARSLTDSGSSTTSRTRR
jgi:predicted helicase